LIVGSWQLAVEQEGKLKNSKLGQN
jgi:hypothetical protein